MNRSTYIALSAALLLNSCKKTVTPDLSTTPPQIVIQGEVTDAAGPYTITINQSVAFYADNNFPAISGAAVKIHDDQGGTDSLTETSPGVYTTQGLQGKPGNTYTLSVTVQGTAYTAVSTMPAPVPLDSVTFLSSSDFGGTQLEAVANFQDPAGRKNYYQFLEYINGQLFNKNIFVFDDRLSDGRYISNTLRTDSIWLHQGYQLEVKMYSIDENVYNYFFQLDQSSGGGTLNTTASPANPASNIIGGAYGYFSAHTVQSKKTIVY